MASANKDKLLADLSAYLDGELSPERARAVRQLLDQSQEARQVLADLRTISQGLRDLPRTRAPQDLIERICPGAERQALLQKTRPEKARLVKLFARVTAAAALIALCMFAGWTIRERMSSPIPREMARAVLAEKAPTVHDAKGVETLGRGLAPTEDASVTEGLTDAVAADTAKPPPEVATITRAEATRLKALGYVGDRVLEDEPGLTVATTESPRELAVAAKPETVAAPTESGFAGVILSAGAAISASEPTPVVSVLITPDDVDQYCAAMQTVAQWQQPVAAAASGGGRAFGALAADGRKRESLTKDLTTTRRKRAPGTPTVQEFTLEVPPDRVNELLLSLGQQAPQQVQATMRFGPEDISQVQRIVMSPPAPPLGGKAPSASPTVDNLSEAPDFADTSRPKRSQAPAGPDKIDGGRGGGRGGSRGRVVRRPADAEAAAPAVIEEAEERRGMHAFRMGERFEAEAARRGRPSQELDEDIIDEAQPKSVPGEKEAAADQRHPRVEDVAARVALQPWSAAHGKLRSAGTRRDTRSPTVTLPLFDQVGRVQQRMRDAYGIMLDVVFRTDLANKRPREPLPAPVKLRVTLLPPATPPAAQPDVKRSPSDPSP